MPDCTCRQGRPDFSAGRQAAKEGAPGKDLPSLLQFSLLNRSMEENYGKLVDSCVISVSRLDAWYLDSANHQGHPICSEWEGFPYSQRYTLLFSLASSSSFHPVASDSKLDETFSVNPSEVNPTPRPRPANRYPYLPPGSP
jgi:hypothetical protein